MDKQAMRSDNKPVTINDLEGVPVKFIMVKINPELYDLVAKMADKAGLPMGEFMVGLAAIKAARPELAFVPRKRMGRPRKELAAAV